MDGSRDRPLSLDLLLDTHIALWLASGDDRLKSVTTSTIDHAWSHGGKVYLSSVSVWEVGQLIDLRRIDLNTSATRWVELFVAQPGAELVPLSWRAAARAYEISGFEHRDPADRLLIATALDLGCPMVTYDRKIVELARDHGDHLGFTIAG